MKKIFIAILLAIALGIGIGLYLFNQQPLDTREVSAAFTVTANELVKEFSEDETAASKKYVDRVLLVSGTVGEVKLMGTEGSVAFQSDDPMSGITCSFYSDEIKSLTDIKSGAVVKIKGKCTGKLMDVVLNNCSLVH